MDDRLAETVQVLRSMGESGWACYLADEDHAGDWVAAVREAGWSPLRITLTQDSQPRGQDDVQVQLAPRDLPELLHQRFPPGRPLHQLIVESEDTDAQLTAVAEAKPWILGTTTGAAHIPGYTHVVSREWHWWLRDDQQHLAPGLTQLTHSEPVIGSSPPNLLRRVLAGRLRPYAIQLAYRMPGPLRARLAEKRHLEAVQPNQAHLTHAAFLQPQAPANIQWLTPEGLPPIPSAARSLDPMSPEQITEARSWLAEPHDADAMLDRRMDNHGDELGRTRDALRTRLAIAERGDVQPRALNGAVGSSVLVDARSLQSPAFGTRGIGRFALSMVHAVRASVGDDATTLLIDPTLEPLPVDIRGDCHMVRCIDETADYAAIIQPSPMTASPDPLLPGLLAGMPSLALAFDFIPAHYPGVYLSHPAAHAEYAANLDALALYGEYLAISQTTAYELQQLLLQRGRSAVQCEVAWPTSITSGSQSTAMSTNSGPIVIMTGDDPRKNTFGALAAVGAATSGDHPPRDVVVIGMAGQANRVHHLSIAAAIRPGETRTADRIDDSELSELLASASAVVVASFDEGLSLPVIEGLRHGTPVIASDIPAHRELIGPGDHLAPAGDLAAFSAAIRRHRGSTATARRQAARLAAHQHANLEEAIRERLAGVRIQASPAQTTKAARDRRFSVAVMTPLPPQATGIADFTAATMREFAAHADLTYFTTTDASEGEPLESLPEIAHEFDAVIAVIGNSHYHLTILEALARLRCTSTAQTIVIAHDTRMIEYYTALRSKAGAEALMLRGQGQWELDPSFDEQLEDMRLLQNAGMWEVAHLADHLVMHAVGASERIKGETGVTPTLLPFAYYRSPDLSEISATTRMQARERIGVPEQDLFLASLGYIDTRTKMTDVVVEAAAWLTQWGHRVSLHLVGAAPAELERSLTKRAEQAGLQDFRITGFVDEATFRDYLLGIDLGVQLRISPMLGVSGPLADMAAFGTPAVASRGLAVDIDAPEYIYRLPENVSPLLVAEAIEEAQMSPPDATTIEMQRAEYLQQLSPEVYARRLLQVLKEVLS